MSRVTNRLRDRIRGLLRPTSPLPRPTRRNLRFDTGLALGLVVVATWGKSAAEDLIRVPRAVLANDRVISPVMTVHDDHQDPRIGVVAAMLLVAVPLLLRRWYPLAVLGIVLVMAPLAAGEDDTLRLSFYACVIAAYSAAVYSPYRILALAGLPVAAVVYTALPESAFPTVPEDAVPFLILLPLAAVATGIRRWRRRAEEGAARLSKLERDQAEALRRAAEHERARIARELHDVVTHNVSMMVIQAGAARKVMAHTPDQAREALLAVEAGGRAAMTELRHVMGLLTMDSDDDGPELAPQPGLDGLDALVGRVRDSGVPVELTVVGAYQPLPSGVELAAYRVVQEALTNTVKHASGASAQVVVDFADDHVGVKVTDTGGQADPAAAAGNGRGLIGLRERLAVYGGTLDAGPRVRGGYRVQALIPLETP